MNVDSTKTCKNCGADYLESENFNWSCRTHKSDYSGEMYWCCGKLKQDAPGCKFEKHQARTDADDEDMLADNNKVGQKKEVCKCCKETGHPTNKCENDPNFHTTSADQIELQQNRLNRIVDKKKLFAHTLV